MPAPSGLVGGPRLRPYVLRPYALGPPHRLQAYLFGVRRSLSARPYLCRLTLSGCHAWVCLGISPALMVPRSSAFHSVFSATHGRKANTKGTVTPLWMYKKLEKKKKKAICKAFLGCFSRVFKLFLDTRKNRALKALFFSPAWLPTVASQAIFNLPIGRKLKGKTLHPRRPRAFWGFLFIPKFQAVFVQHRLFCTKIRHG